MDSNEQYWADRILRIAKKEGWIRESDKLTGDNAPYYFGWFTTTCTRRENLHEEILTALRHEDPVVAFRSVMTATKNSALMREAGEEHFLHDALRTAQCRVEGLLRAKPENN